MALTGIEVKTAKPKEKDYRLTDGNGLYLQVTPAGGKWWRFRYFIGGKEKMISFGTYPDISLAEARDKRQEARNQVANGIDPGGERKALKEALAEKASVIENSFEVVAREWHGKFSGQWTPGHAATIMDRLSRDVFPWIGGKPVSEVKPVDLLAVLHRVEGRGALETAHRIRTIAGQVLRYAVATGRAERDAAADLRGALPPVQEKHHAALTDPKEVAELLRAIDGFKGTFHVKCALKLAPMLFARPGELRQMEWAEIDIEAEQWNIPAEKMKMKLAHIVPLCRQAVTILKELQPLTGNGRYVFPCHRSPLRPMTNNAINAALRRMGYTSDEMTGHGFRAMARTILDEVLQVRVDFIEHQLAHAVKDANGRAYNRTSHLPERRKMMQLWADYLEELKQVAKVIPFNRGGGVMGNGEGILRPPSGLSIREQARWWMREPEMFMVAHVNGEITADVMSEIEQVTKDHDRAFKIADSNKVDGLTREDRARLFSMLTDGGECPVPRKGAPSKALSDLRIAYGLKDISDPVERKRLLNEAVSAELVVGKEAINKRIKRIEKQWQSLSCINPELIGSFLKACQEDDKITFDGIRFILSSLQLMYTQEPPALYE